MSTIFVEINNNRIDITASYSDKDSIRLIPGARWRKDDNKWHVPLSWSAAKQLRGVFKDRLEIGPELYKWAANEVSSRVSPANSLRLATTVVDVSGLVPGLYPFQQAGAQFLIAANDAILADPVGSGKTIQAIAAARATNNIPGLVICPNSMKRTWAREIKKWWPGVPVFVPEGSAAKRSKTILESADQNGFVILNWEAVRLHSALAGYGSIALTEKEKQIKELNRVPFKLVIADEAHRLKDPKSKQTRAVWKVAHGPTVQTRWALTGTPLVNKPDTLWPILHFLNKEEWPSKVQFIDRYCQTGFNYWGGLDIFGLLEDTKDEFFEIFDPRFRRLPKEVVLPHLPPVVRVTKTLDMGTKQAKGYNEMAERMVTETPDGGLLIAVNPISQVTRLVQFSSATIEFDGSDLPVLVDPSNKLDQLMEDIPELLEDGESVVVFAVSRQLIEMAEKRLAKAEISYSVIKGNQNAEFRQYQIDQFQDKKVHVILVVAAAGGTGITLTAARIGIFLQRSWSLVDNIQCEGRFHRIGSEQHESVVVIDYVSRGTFDEVICEALAGKQINLEEVVRDSDTIRRLLSGETD